MKGVVVYKEVIASISPSLQLLQDSLQLFSFLQISFAAIIIMSGTVTAIGLLIEAFSKHAGKEGDSNTLTKGELKDLLQNELGDLLGKASDKAALDRIFKDLDANQDNSVDFQEFVRMVACLAVMCHDHFTGKK